MARRSRRPRPPGLAGAFRSFDAIGDIIVCRIPSVLEGEEKRIGEALLEANPKSRLVLKVTGATEEGTRRRPLLKIAGEGPATTEHRESGAIFVVDLPRVFFTPRLNHERKRVSEQVQNGERVLNMFSGVGSFSILIALNARADVYSVDKNPAAIECMRAGIKRNALTGRVFPLLADSRRICPSMHGMDRVILPLPAMADELIPTSLGTLGEGGVVHHYREATGAHRDCVSRSESDLRRLLSPLEGNWRFEFSCSRPVRSVGKRRWHVVHDILSQRR